MPATPTDAVGRVYAQALVELAESENQLDAIAEEVADLSSLLDTDADLIRLIDNPIIDGKARAGMVERLFKDKVSDLLYRFLQVVNQKDRLDALPNITAGFGDLIAEKRNQLDVDAFVASTMDDATVGRVADGLSAALGKEINLVQHVDESLIGGVKLRIGDQMIDASVQSQLNRMEQQLIAAGREKARAAAASMD